MPGARLTVAQRRTIERAYRIGLSPEQVANTPPAMFPDDRRMRVSHEAIYQSLFVQTRGELRRALTAHLRTGRSRRRPQTGGAKRITLGITEEVRISARPAEAEDRAVPGHWGGRPAPRRHRQERGQHAGRTLQPFRAAGAAPGPAHRRDRPQDPCGVDRDPAAELRKSITWDRGSEMAQHAQFKVDTDVQIYFADPQAPWQRGSNENTNGLLRQYWPKGADLRHLTSTECERVALKLNTRPRKTLDWQTPAQALNPRLVATAS